METTAEENDLSSSEQQLLLRIRDASVTTWTPECLEPETVLDIIQQKEDSAMAAAQMAHIASCANCRQSYVSMLETWCLAQEVRSLEMAATATPPVILPMSKKTASASRRQFMSALFSGLFSSKSQPKPQSLAKSLNWNLQRRILVPAFALLIVTLPLFSAWLVKQNANLRTQLANQAVPTGGESGSSNAPIALTQSQLALLSDTHHQTMSASGNDLPIVTLMYPLERTLIHEDMPILRWKPVEGATSYTVILSDISNRHLKIKPPAGIAVTQWKLDSPLPRSDVFEWGIEALNKNGDILARSYIEHFLVLAK